MRTCETCKHYNRPKDEIECIMALFDEVNVRRGLPYACLDPIFKCTLNPRWVPVERYHYCGQWEGMDDE